MKNLVLISVVLLIGIVITAVNLGPAIYKTKIENRQNEKSWHRQFRGEKMCKNKQFKGERMRKNNIKFEHSAKMHQNLKKILSEKELITLDSLRNGMKALWKERKELHKEMQALRDEMKSIMEPHKNEIRTLMHNNNFN